MFGRMTDFIRSAWYYLFYATPSCEGREVLQWGRSPAQGVLPNTYTRGAQPRPYHVPLSPGEKGDVLLGQIY